MGIQGKSWIILRIIGMILLLTGIILSIISDLLTIADPILNASIISIMVLWFLYTFLAKLEINYLRSNFNKMVMILLIFSIILIIIFSLTNLHEKYIIAYAFLTFSDIVIILSWHYSLSLYKKEKIIFILAAIVYLLISMIFRIPFKKFEIEIFKISALTLIILSLILIFCMEIIMKKRGLLHYL